MLPRTKRINIFAYDENEEGKRPKFDIPMNQPLCKRHNRYCGPNHERFWIGEEGRWMNSWEEYKYVNSADYYVDVPVYFCGATLDRVCVLCERYIQFHDAYSSPSLGGQMIFPCTDRLMRKWYNKYTHMCVLLPTIIDIEEERKSKATQYN